MEACRVAIEDTDDFLWILVSALTIKRFANTGVIVLMEVALGTVTLAAYAPGSVLGTSPELLHYPSQYP